MRKKIAELISTVFFIGKIKYAPGTFGSLPAFPLCYMIMYFVLNNKIVFPIDGFDASTLAVNNEHLPTNTPVYDLFATCEHSGRLNYGHYTATCLDPTSRKWYKFDDVCVSQCCPKKIDKSAAYVLFYKQRTS